MSKSLALVAFLVVSFLPGSKPEPMTPDPDGPRPIAALDTVFIEEMTWMEVRDAMRAGKDTVIIATGGVEQNGPYLATGKHNYVLRATTAAIARKLGDALVAPIVAFVPEGDFDPPTLHMKYPGTISVTEETYQALLTDICRSFRTHGFRHIVLIGDSGGNQSGLKEVTAKLNQKWGNGKTRVYYIAEYYNFDDVGKWLKQRGIHPEPEGLHDDFGMTAVILSVDPTAVRMEQRIAANNFRIDGIELSPAGKTMEWGRRIVDFRAEAATRGIRKARGK